MTVRSAEMSDRFAMLRLGRDFLEASGLPLPFDPVHAEACVKAHIADADKLALVLDEGTPRGVLLAHVQPCLLAPVRMACELIWWIDPERRGRGRMMLRAYEAWAETQGADLICLSAYGERAARLYPALGYREAGGVWWREAR
jgi:GNAT superfamily N-acetyltransferase